MLTMREDSQLEIGSVSVKCRGCDVAHGVASNEHGGFEGESAVACSRCALPVVGSRLTVVSVEG